MLNIKITAQTHRITQTKQRKAKKVHGWTKLESIQTDCILVNLKNVGPPSPFSNLYQIIAKCHFDNWKIILSCIWP